MARIVEKNKKNKKSNIVSTPVYEEVDEQQRFVNGVNSTDKQPVQTPDVATNEVIEGVSTVAEPFNVHYNGDNNTVVYPENLISADKEDKGSIFPIIYNINDPQTQDVSLTDMGIDFGETSTETGSVVTYDNFNTEIPIEYMEVQQQANTQEEVKPQEKTEESGLSEVDSLSTAKVTSRAGTYNLGTTTDKVDGNNVRVTTFTVDTYDKDGDKKHPVHTQNISIMGNNNAIKATKFLFTTKDNEGKNQEIARVVENENGLNLSIKPEQVKNLKTGNAAIDTLISQIAEGQQIPIEKASMLNNEGNISVQLQGTGIVVRMTKDGYLFHDPAEKKTYKLDVKNKVDIAMSRDTVAEMLAGSDRISLVADKQKVKNPATSELGSHMLAALGQNINNNSRFKSNDIEVSKLGLSGKSPDHIVTSKIGDKFYISGKVVGSSKKADAVGTQEIRAITLVSYVNSEGKPQTALKFETSAKNGSNVIPFYIDVDANNVVDKKTIHALNNTFPGKVFGVGEKGELDFAEDPVKFDSLNRIRNEVSKLARTEGKDDHKEIVPEPQPPVNPEENDENRNGLVDGGTGDNGDGGNGGSGDTNPPPVVEEDTVAQDDTLTRDISNITHTTGPSKSALKGDKASIGEQIFDTGIDILTAPLASKDAKSLTACLLVTAAIVCISVPFLQIAVVPLLFIGAVVNEMSPLSTTRAKRQAKRREKRQAKRERTIERAKHNLLKLAVERNKIFAKADKKLDKILAKINEKIYAKEAEINKLEENNTLSPKVKEAEINKLKNQLKELKEQKQHLGLNEENRNKLVKKKQEIADTKALLEKMKGDEKVDKKVYTQQVEHLRRLENELTELETQELSLSKQDKNKLKENTESIRRTNETLEHTQTEHDAIESANKGEPYVPKAVREAQAQAESNKTQEMAVQAELESGVDLNNNGVADINELNQEWADSKGDLNGDGISNEDVKTAETQTQTVETETQVTPTRNEDKEIERAL